MQENTLPEFFETIIKKYIKLGYLQIQLNMDIAIFWIDESSIHFILTQLYCYIRFCV